MTISSLCFLSSSCLFLRTGFLLTSVTSSVAIGVGIDTGALSDSSDVASGDIGLDFLGIMFIY